jgi:cytochrome c oxidase assembly factor CtaG
VAVIADLAESAGVLGYLVLVRRMKRRGRPWDPVATAAFILGVVATWVAIGSGLASLGDTSETAHVIQHVILMMVAAPLLVAGRPLTLACQGSPRRAQVRLIRVLRSAPASLLTSPWVSWPLYVIGMFVYWLCRPLYTATITHPWLHEATHAAFFTIGLLYWQPLLGDGSSGRPLSHPVRILGVLVTMPFELLIGVGMTLLPHPLDPGGSLGANRAAGQIFWITTMLCSGLAVGAMSIDWLARDERAAARGPRTLARSDPRPA